MILSQNASAVRKGIITYFLASGGTAPYAYSVLAGGAGGSINVSSGLYTAPFVNGVDTIRAIDSSFIPVQVDLSISVLSPLEILCDIFQKALGLASGRVSIYDQKINIPTDSGLFISVGILSCKPFSNSRKFDGTSDIQSTNFSAMVSVDILSKSTEALDRKEEVVMALNSSYSQKQQQANSISISTIPSAFISLHEQQGASILYRFNFSLQMFYAEKTIVSPEYYDIFQTSTILIDT